MLDTQENRGAAVEVQFSSEEIAELDAWRADQTPELTRPEAVKTLVRRAIDIEREWEEAKRSARPDEGIRADELTTENDL